MAENISWSSEELHLIATDFLGIYNTNNQATVERIELTKLAITIYSSPFVVMAALLTAGEIILNNIQELPAYLYGFILICGIIGIVPFMRFIEVNKTHLRTARVINQFRNLYVMIFQDRFERLNWMVNLPIDPFFPPNLQIGGWGTIWSIISSLINSVYIVFGAWGLDNDKTFGLIESLLGFFVFGLHIAWYLFKSDYKDRNKYHTSPLNQQELNDEKNKKLRTEV